MFLSSICAMELALYAAGGQAGNDLALEDEDEDDQRYGDDHRSRSATHGWPVSQLQQAAAGILERIMHPLPVMPLIRNLGGLPINLHRAGAWPSQRIQHRIQLRTDSVGELAFQLPHAVAALPQLQMPPVLLQLIIDQFRTVGVDRVNYSICDESHVFGA